MQKQVGRVQIKTGRSTIYNFTCVTAVAICCPLYGRLQSLKYNRDCKVSVVSNLCSLPISILHILIFNIFHFQLWAQGDGRHGRHGSFSGAWVRSRGDVEAARIKDSSEAMVGVAIVSSRSHVLYIGRGLFHVSYLRVWVSIIGGVVAAVLIGVRVTFVF